MTRQQNNEEWLAELSKDDPVRDAAILDLLHWLELIDYYAELEQAGENVRGLMPKMNQHFAQS